MAVPKHYLPVAALLMLLFGWADPAPLAAQEGGFTKAERDGFKTSIDEIAKKLIKSAIKKDIGVAWANIKKDDAPEESLDFYQGSPGVCYFLLKAYAATGNKEALACAKEGLAYILSQAKEDDKGLYFHKTFNGVFVGNAAAGYLFLYAYHVTKDQAYLKLAEEIAGRIVSVPDTADKSSPDIISGAAGAGLFLLKMHAAAKKAKYLEGAEALGDFLIAKAEKRARGVTWKVGGGKKEFYFVGFSHGPAGIGYYLDRLYHATKKDKYKDCSAQAMDYIEDVAIMEKNYVKWFHDEGERKTRYSSQWCHGAPGMTPFFLERYAVTSDKKYLDWAVKNTRYLLDQGVDVRKNASVCHGIAGNAAPLYILFLTTGDRQYLQDTRDALKLLQETVKKGPDGYTWDPPAFKTDHGYMTGLAGIGDFYAFLYSEGKLRMMGALGYGDDM